MTTAESCPVLDLPFMGVGSALEGMTRLDHLQAQGVTVARVEGEANAYWVVLDRALIVQVLQDPATFSSSAIVPTQPDPPIAMIPVQIDPPQHAKWRQLLAEYFSPRTIRALEPHMRERAVERIEAVREKGSSDFVTDIALQYPTSIFLEICGLPTAELPTFLGWLDAMIKPQADGSFDSEAQLATMMQVFGRFLTLIQEKRADPTPDRPDIISAAASWEIDGRPAEDLEILSACLLLFLAGLDTVAQQLSFSMLHLAQHPEDRARVSDAATVGPAIEELMRLYTLAEVGRKVTRDVQLGGVQLKAGDMVGLPLMAANRDERHIACPHVADFERDVPVVNYGFGAGPHRCLGMHLARQEMKVLLEEWHARVPAYALEDGAVVEGYWGPVHGLRAVPLTW